jgi:hypothetical protein
MSLAAKSSGEGHLTVLETGGFLLSTNAKVKKMTTVSVVMFEIVEMDCPRNRYFSQITLTNRIYLFNSAEYLIASKTVACKHGCYSNYSGFFFQPTLK